MEAYSLDLRKRVLASCDAGHETKQVADLYGVSPAWVRRLKQRRHKLGIIDRLPQNPGRKSKLTAEDRQRLAELVRQQPDATCGELRDRLGVAVDETTIGRALAKLGLSFKKSRSTPLSKTAPTSKHVDVSGTSSSTR
jgi:transposase